MLPAVPQVAGPLRLDVVHPPEGATVSDADSTFVFGSTGTGAARMTINGAIVPVAPNGAFLGFLPVPLDGVYHVEAMTASEAARLARRINVPSPPPARGGAWIFRESIYPVGAVALPLGALIEVGFTGARGGRAAVWLPTGERIPLVQGRPTNPVSAAASFRRVPGGATRPGVATYRGNLVVRERIVAGDPAVSPPKLWTAASLRAGVDRGVRPPARGNAVVELIVGSDTVREALPIDLVPLDPASPRVGLVEAPPEAADDWMTRGRNATSGPFHYFWPPGTRLWLTGERDGMFRVRLAEGRSAWVPAADVRLLLEGTPPPIVTVSEARLTPRAEFIDLRIAVPERLPFAVDEEERVLHVSVFGATSRINFFQYGGLDPLIDRAEWSQPADGVLRFSVHLTAPVWGYDTFFDATGALIVRIRRPPAIDPERPLAGLLVAVDAGHPPGGAIGPTRFTEAEANLAVALRLEALLEAAGARVVMTRTDAGPVDLAQRPRLARDASAHVLVSTHNNAFPEGVNPFENNGTSVYYFHAHSADLAKAFQGELVAELGLRDLGIGRADLALVRPTWMPSALTETAFLMLPEQEAALRDPAVQDRIARAHLRALEAFLLERSRRAGASDRD